MDAEFFVPRYFRDYIAELKIANNIEGYSENYTELPRHRGTYHRAETGKSYHVSLDVAYELCHLYGGSLSELEEYIFNKKKGGRND